MNSDGHFPIGTCFGVYELTGVIGEGGMGTVYAAVHRTLGKRVAIKTLRTQLAGDPDLRARFVREGKAAAAVHHPNVVDVDDVGIAGDTPYLVMELLEGESLGARITRLGRLTIPDLLDVILPVLLALAEAHRAGVVHRDLKPDNIFIATDYHGVSVPKLLDFGISKLREGHSLGLTQERMLLGTPHYMPPEQAASARDVDARSDLYSMGVILYHGVSGRVPFAGTTLSQVIGQILHAQPVPLRELASDLPPAFDAIVLRCLAKDPAHRYQDALMLARELLPFASMRMQLTYRPVLVPGTPRQNVEAMDVDPTRVSDPASQVDTSKAVVLRSRLRRHAAWLVPLALVLGIAAHFAYSRATQTSSAAATSLRPSTVQRALQTKQTEQIERASPGAEDAPSSQRQAARAREGAQAQASGAATAPDSRAPSSAAVDTRAPEAAPSSQAPVHGPATRLPGKGDANLKPGQAGADHRAASRKAERAAGVGSHKPPSKPALGATTARVPDASNASAPDARAHDAPSASAPDAHGAHGIQRRSEDDDIWNDRH